MLRNSKNAPAILIFSLALVFFATPAIALAEHETIGPLDVVPGEPEWFEFPNIVLPPPNFKILEFHGTAFSTTPGATNPAILGLEFDYIDPVTGQQEFIPGGEFPIDPGAITPVWSGTTLPFCPDLVSIHFSVEDLTGTGAPVTVEGEFWHECRAVPEPSTPVLVALGVPALVALGRRRRRCRSNASHNHGDRVR